MVVVAHTQRLGRRRSPLAGAWLCGLVCLALAGPGAGSAHAKRPTRAARKAPAQWPQPKPLALERFTLSNGMRVVVQPDHRAPVVAVGIMVNVGARDETKGRSGLAHFFEHMMFQGSERVGKMEHFTALEAVGADLNANTSLDRTYYYEVVPKGALELALWLESDRFAHLKINAANVENQRQTVMEERRQRYDNRPYAASRLALLRLAFSTWPLAHSTIGSMDDLKRAPLDAFVQFWRHWYTPNNCVLVLVGDVTPAAARTLAEATMGRIPRRAEPTHQRFAEPEPTGHAYATYAEPLGKMPAVHLAWRVPARPHPDAWAIDVLAEVLDGGDASRLTRKLEKETGLATRHWAGNYGRRDVDIFHFAAELSQATAAAMGQTKHIVRGALYDIMIRGVTAKELQRAKVSFEAGYVFGTLSLSARAHLLARYETYYGDAGKLNGALARWRAVTAADVQRVARRWFRWHREAELDVLPKGFAAPPPGTSMPRDVAGWERTLKRKLAAEAKAAERAKRRAAAKAARAAAKAARAAKAAEARAARAAKVAAAKAARDAAKAARAAKAKARAAVKAAAKQARATDKAKLRADAAAAQLAEDRARRAAATPKGPAKVDPSAVGATGAAPGDDNDDDGDDGDDDKDSPPASPPAPATPAAASSGGAR